MTEQDKAFMRAFRRFDFDAVRALMLHKQWEWRNIGVPTTADMREAVFEFWLSIRAQDGTPSTSSGGFTVGVSPDDPNCVYISFEMSEVEEIE